MIHTSPNQEDHDAWAKALHALYGKRVKPGPVVSLEPPKLRADLDADESMWRAWFDRFSQSRNRLYETRPHEGPQTECAWPDVKAKLAEVFEHTKVKIVNSDAGGSSLDYRPVLGPDGAPIRAQDVLVIAVGGARLSRGITVEGLGITYFARWAAYRMDDTLLQMSRWFGYRGPFLEFCRVFTTPAAYRGLAEIAENDILLRAQLGELMAQGKSPRDATIVFRASPYTRPTAKQGAGKVVDLCFSPFSTVFPKVEVGPLQASNEGVAAGLAQRILAGEEIRNDNGTLRGRLIRGWSLVDVAAALEGLAYSDHNPNAADNLMPGAYRAADQSRPTCRALPPEQDPYQVAAYLRLWHSTLKPGDPVPTFNVGVTFGEMASDTAPMGFPLLNRKVTPDGRAEGGWTGRSHYWRGDALFDGVGPEHLDAHRGRKEGAPGLLLLHAAHKAAEGRFGGGIQRQHHTPFFGISVPAGGPPFIRVLSPGGSDARTA